MSYPTDETFEAARSQPWPPRVNYRAEVLRNCPNFGTDELSTKLNLGALGLAGETGEVVDLIKKINFHGKPFTPEIRAKLIKELGDVRWYLEYLAASLNTSMVEIETTNVAKLRARYPDGFSHEAANAKRDD